MDVFIDERHHHQASWRNARGRWQLRRLAILADVKERHERIKLSDAEAELLLELVTESPPALKAAAGLVAVGGVVPDDDAEAIIDVLCDAMLGEEGFEGRH